MSDQIEGATGQAPGDLYAERIFGRAALTRATLQPDTRAPLYGLVGYERNEALGHLPAQNGIYRIGAAGISASRDDMLAWEAFIDATRDDPQGLYSRLSVQPRFAPGTPASCGRGLAHDLVTWVATTGHGGALRGFRAHRIPAAAERLSDVVIFYHAADARAAAICLQETALLHAPKVKSMVPQGWDGLWLEEAQGHLLRSEACATGITLHQATTPSRLTPDPDGEARASGASLLRRPAGLTLQCHAENLTASSRALTPVDMPILRTLPDATVRRNQTPF